MEGVCFKKKRNEAHQPDKKLERSMKRIKEVNKANFKTVKAISTTQQVMQTVVIRGTSISCEVDTGAADNFLSTDVWGKLGQPNLGTHRTHYESASRHALPVQGSFTASVSLPNEGNTTDLQFVVTELPGLNLLG